MLCPKCGEKLDFKQARKIAQGKLEYKASKYFCKKDKTVVLVGFLIKPKKKK